MPSLGTNEIPTIYRNESYEAFLEELPQQSKELEDQGFYDLFPVKEIAEYSTFKTHVYGSFNQESARNPGEPLPPGQMAQGYNYWTAIRAEFTEVRTIHAEYLASVMKFEDYAREQGRIQAANFAQAKATYFTDLLGYGGVAAATLLAVGNGTAGQRPRARIFNHALKGEGGAIIAQIPNIDAAIPDTASNVALPWFTFAGNEHALANGDTSASYAGKTLGFFNAGNSNGANMALNENNLSNALLHIENDLPWGPDRKFYAAPVIDTLIVSGNLRVVAAELIDLNEFRLNTPNNDKNTVYKQSKVFGINKIIVNRFLPDNCWYLTASGHGVKCVYSSADVAKLGGGAEGPIKSTLVDVFFDKNSRTWVRQFLAYWSHWFDENAITCWYAGSTPTAITSGTNRPTAPTAASLAQTWA